MHDFTAEGSLVFRGSNDEVIEHLADKGLDVLGVHELIDQFQGTLSNGDIGVFEAVDDGVAVSLDGGGVLGDDFTEGVEGDVADVVVTVEEEAPENVDGEHAQARFGFDGHDGLHALVQDGIAGVFGRFGVGGDLGEEVIHGIAGFRVVFPEALKHVQQLDLEEGVGYPGHVMVGGIAHGEEVPQETEDGGDEPGEGWGVGGVHTHDLGHEFHPCHEDTVAPVLEEGSDPFDEIFDEVGDFPKDADGGEGGFFTEVAVGGLEVFVDVHGKVTGDVFGGQVADRGEGEPDDERVGRHEVVFDGVGDEGQDFFLFGEEEGEAEVPNAFLKEVRGGDEFEAFHLTEMAGVTQHVDKQKLGHVSVPVLLVLFLDGRADEGGLLGNDGALLCCCLAGADGPDQFP